MYRLGELDPELVAIVVFAAIAGVGGWLHAAVLALFGALGLLSALVLYLWQRECLVRLRYVRHLGQHRAEFGEEVDLSCELVNDKLLPLPWVRVADVVPSTLRLNNATVRDREEEGDHVLLQAFSLLPFQRALRHVSVVCERRGRHVFGASEVRSGDLLGLRHRVVRVEAEDELIVYPKVFPLPALTLAARTPIGDERARSMLLADPSRVAGMRAYRAGDPLRHVDWRATARSGELLVRDFEATTTPRVVIFFDLAPGDGAAAVEEREFALSLAASVLVHLGGRGLPVGLYGPGLADGDPVAYDPTSAPGAVGSMLELLALCEVDPRASLAGVLAEEAERLRRQALVLVISSRFDAPLLAAIARCRRKAPVTALFVEGPHARAPLSGSVDALYRVDRPDDWQHQEVLQLAG